MASSTSRRWYVRLPIRDMGRVVCPRCGEPYAVGPMFDHDPRVCLSCRATLIEWLMLTTIYLIDIEKAPPMVHVIVNYLAPLTEQEADSELTSLLRFLGVEPEL